jgi:hypothetical protein
MAVANISHLYKVFRLVKKWKEVQQSGIVTFNGKKTQSIADTLPILGKKSCAVLLREKLLSEIRN